LESWCFLSQGWTKGYRAGFTIEEYTHPDGTKQEQHPGKPEGIIALANAIPDMRALSSLNLADNGLGEIMLPEGWRRTGETEWTHTDGSKAYAKPGKPEGIIALANAIPGMGAILSVNLLNNKIGVDQAKALASILKEHPTLKSLCGNSGEETELDMSGRGMDAGDAIMLVPEIVDNGLLTSLNLSSTNIGRADQEQAQTDVEVLLQSFGTGIKALQEHFEQPEDDSAAANISMVSTQRFEHFLSLMPPYHLPLTTRLLQTDCCCP
jgi:hypothetical protein